MSLVDNFNRDGFCLLANAIYHTDLEQIQRAVDVIAKDQANAKQAAGLRGLLAKSATISTLADTVFRDIAASLLEHPSHRLRAVRAILFDKNPKTNWYVTWHQDLAIPVIARHEVSGYGPWSIKDGVPHIAMRPLVLHSSAEAESPAKRRVLHVEFASIDLPSPLEWGRA